MPNLTPRSRAKTLRRARVRVTEASTVRSEAAEVVRTWTRYSERTRSGNVFQDTTVVVYAFGSRGQSEAQSGISSLQPQAVWPVQPSKSAASCAGGLPAVSRKLSDSGAPVLSVVGMGISPATSPGADSRRPRPSRACPGPDRIPDCDRTLPPTLCRCSDSGCDAASGLARDDRRSSGRAGRSCCEPADRGLLWR